MFGIVLQGEMSSYKQIYTGFSLLCDFNMHGMAL